MEHIHSLVKDKRDSIQREIAAINNLGELADVDGLWMRAEHGIIEIRILEWVLSELEKDMG